MKTFILAVAIFILSPVLAHAQKKCDGTPFTGSSFMICMPSGFELSGPKDGKTTLNNNAQRVSIRLYSRDVELSIYEYALADIEGTLKSNTDRVTNIRLVEIHEIQTESGLDGVRMIFLCESDGRPYKIMSYVFELTGNAKFGLIATLPQSDKTWPKVIDTDILTLSLK